MKKIWDKVSYEFIIVMFFGMQFLMTRAEELQMWSSAWSAMDYSMGKGSRLLIGSIYHLFYDEYMPYQKAYFYTAAGILVVILGLAVTLGQLIRIGCAHFPEYKTAIIGGVIIYAVSPWSVSYIWNGQNLGRFDGYMLLMGAMAVLTALLVKNVYVRFLLFTLIGVIGLAIHQGFAFLYYPMVLIVMCYDVFHDQVVRVKNLILAVVSGGVNVAVAVYFQFFSSLKYETLDEVIAAIQKRTDLDIMDWAIEIEYFGGMEEQLSTITPEFFRSDAPFVHTFLILLLLSPVLGIYVVMWKDIFHYIKTEKLSLFRSPYLYVLLAHLCYVPMFALHTDWGRHFAPWFTLETFIFLFYLAKQDAAMVYAFGKMKDRIVRYPLYFVAATAWIATFDSFGARNPFLEEAEMLYQLLQHGFFE